MKTLILHNPRLMCLAENRKLYIDILEDGLRFSWVIRSVVVTASVSRPLYSKHMDMMNIRTSRRPAPSWTSLLCVSAAHGTYWGSKTSLMRARRSLSESTLASWFTSRDAVSESSRRLKSLHSTGKENNPKNVTTGRQSEHRTWNWWSSHRYGHSPFWLRTRETKGGRM